MSTDVRKAAEFGTMVAPVAEVRDLAKPIYPWFGSKRRVADVIWQNFGDVDNFVDQFLGTNSVLLTH